MFITQGKGINVVVKHFFFVTGYRTKKVRVFDPNTLLLKITVPSIDVSLLPIVEKC